MGPIWGFNGTNGSYNKMGSKRAGPCKTYMGINVGFYGHGHGHKVGILYGDLMGLMGCTKMGSQKAYPYGAPLWDSWAIWVILRWIFKSQTFQSQTPC